MAPISRQPRQSDTVIDDGIDPEEDSYFAVPRYQPAAASRPPPAAAVDTSTASGDASHATMASVDVSDFVSELDAALNLSAIEPDDADRSDGPWDEPGGSNEDEASRNSETGCLDLSDSTVDVDGGDETGDGGAVDEVAGGDDG